MKGDLDRYLKMGSWYQSEHTDTGTLIGYFSLEFGLHESLPLYSGGLGILAGDHLKSASDLGLPLVGMGLAYQYGYFRQYLNHDGWQMEEYAPNDFHNMSMSLEQDDEGRDITIEVHYPGRTVVARIWRVQVGRNPLFLLDTNLPVNRPEDRELTSKLYSGDHDMRIRQEIMLGIGGLRALIKLGMEPTVCHLNEGHSAFLGLERINLLMKNRGLSYETAFEMVRASNVFTTHTPVPAGNDHFHPDLVRTYLRRKADEMGMGIDDMLALGKQDPENKSETFCMTVLALRLSRFTNGVSELHGHVSRNMWQGVWPQVPSEEIPISHVTNGIHTRSWLCSEIARLYDRYLGPRWFEEPTNKTLWDRLERIPDAELWRSHERMRERLVGFVRGRLRQQLQRRGVNRAWIKAAGQILDPEALTIGFARRFATYKRASLILRDPARLGKILNDPERPVQLVFAGKAHPKDHPGKELIRQLVHLAQNRGLPQPHRLHGGLQHRGGALHGAGGGRVAEHAAPAPGGQRHQRHEGAPQRRHQPVHPGRLVVRGVTTGTTAGPSAPARITTTRNTRTRWRAPPCTICWKTRSCPPSYDRSSDDVPYEWTRIMKNSMRTVNAEFNTHRQVEEYTQRFYRPCMENYERLSNEEYAKAKELAEWRQRVFSGWNKVSVACVDAPPPAAQPMGATLPIRAVVQLGDIPPEEVLVEVYHGLLDPAGNIADGETATLFAGDRLEDGTVVYDGGVPCRRAGQRGFTVRVVPRKDGFHWTRFETGLITWWESDENGQCERKDSPDSGVYAG